MADNNYKEELTTAMHGEFAVSEQTDIKHRAFCAIPCIDDLGYTTEQACELYQVTPEQIKFHRLEYSHLKATE